MKEEASGKPFLYQWSNASASWEKVGEVTNAKDDGSAGATLGKRMFEGKEYDYLFDIDINGAMLKLPFNRGDDAWMSAQQWIWKNGLDQGHLDAIANHIMQNTPGNVPVQMAGNADPFTSSGAYRPSAPPTGGGQGGGNVDPFTSSGAYRPGPASSNQPPPRSTPMEDPLSSKRYRPGNEGAGAVAPAPVTLVFDSAKHDQVLAKLMQFNGQLEASPVDGVAPLDGSQAAALSKLVGVLKDRTMYHATKVSASEVDLFTAPTGLLAWPLPLLFPAVDLFRLLVLHPDAALHLSSQPPALIPRLIGVLATANQAADADKPAAASVLMLLRTFANMASRIELKGMIASSASALVDALSPLIESGAATARLAAITLLHNVCALLVSKELTPEQSLQADGVPLQALSLIHHALSTVPALTRQADLESLFRLLVTLSTLLGSGADMVETAKGLGVGAALSALPALEPPTAPEAAKIGACKAAILKTLG